MSRTVTHIAIVEFYLTKSDNLSEEDIRNQLIGYLEAKTPELDIENITVTKEK